MAEHIIGRREIQGSGASKIDEQYFLYLKKLVLENCGIGDEGASAIFAKLEEKEREMKMMFWGRREQEVGNEPQEEGEEEVLDVIKKKERGDLSKRRRWRGDEEVIKEEEEEEGEEEEGKDY